MRIHTRARRAGISELVGSILAIAITIIAGAAVFGYVNGQAGVTEKQYGQSVGAVVNQMQEKFVIFDLSFPTTPSTCYSGSSYHCISVWTYNTGQTYLLLVSIRVYDSAHLINLVYNYTVSGQTVTDYVYDLNSASGCKTAAVNYENPTVSNFNTNVNTALILTLTIPPTQSGCPSFGQSFQSGTAYSATALAIYGNVETASQVK